MKQWVGGGRMETKTALEDPEPAGGNRMRQPGGWSTIWLGGLLCAVLAACSGHAATELPDGTDPLDVRVRTFLESRRNAWRDMNIPESDGRLLYDLILENGSVRALEIGTSTGHSGIWMAWALSKTGGKLVTVELNRSRRERALENFEEAGLSEHIRSLLGNAHEIVPALEGPFDFVFCDADKDWYVNYLKAVLPKLTDGGCFAAHNVTRRGRGWVAEYLEFVNGIPELETTIDERGAGMAISCRRPAARTD
jgi:caffeoyl-CoA O-methyltransferase